MCKSCKDFFQYFVEARYYLNINRCAYGNDFEYVTPSGRHIYRGPNIFAVDEKCFYSFYYNDRLHIWVRYNSTSWPKKQNIVCDPKSPWKKNTTKIDEVKESGKNGSIEVTYDQISV
jgi:hypothetical protein